MALPLAAARSGGAAGDPQIPSLSAGRHADAGFVWFHAVVLQLPDRPGPSPGGSNASIHADRYGEAHLTGFPERICARLHNPTGQFVPGGVAKSMKLRRPSIALRIDDRPAFSGRAANRSGSGKLSSTACISTMPRSPARRLTIDTRPQPGKQLLSQTCPYYARSISYTGNRCSAPDRAILIRYELRRRFRLIAEASRVWTVISPYEACSGGGRV